MLSDFHSDISYKSHHHLIALIPQRIMPMRSFITHTIWDLNFSRAFTLLMDCPTMNIFARLIRSADLKWSRSSVPPSSYRSPEYSRKYFHSRFWSLRRSHRSLSCLTRDNKDLYANFTTYHKGINYQFSPNHQKFKSQYKIKRLSLMDNLLPHSFYCQ